MQAPSQPELRFPNGHTVAQVKRNAKRLSKEKRIPLNKALDQLAKDALGLPNSHIYWPEAVKALETCWDTYFPAKSFNPEKDSILSVQTANLFINSTVVALDIKDAMEFKKRGPWHEEEALSALLYPAIVALIAHSYADEENRKTPNDEEWEDAKEHAFSYELFKYTGSTAFKNTKEIIQDIVERNYFYPIAIWEKGIMTFGL